jgi:hypothetical protein
MRARTGRPSRQAGQYDAPAFNLNVVNATWTAKNGGALGIEIRVSPGP